MTRFFLEFLLVSLPLTFLLYFLHKIINNKSRSDPPGPRGLPFIGNLHQIDNSSLHTSLWQLSKTYGPIISLRFGFIPTIVVSSPNMAKEVLKTQDLVFCSRPSLFGQRRLSYNGLDVAFSPHNDNWREMRKIFTFHLFSPKRLRLLRFIREDEVSSAIKSIREFALSCDRVINVSEMMKGVTSSMMMRMRVGIGKRYEDGHERNNILRALVGFQVKLADIYVSDIWPGLPFCGLADWFMSKMYGLEKCFKYFDEFYQECIDEHLNNQKPKSCEEDEDFIDIMLQLMKDEVFNLTYDHIKAMLMNVLVAGSDTSASTVVWAMASLIKNPKVMKKAQEEVRNVVGKKDKVDEDDLPKLTYLKAVIKETLRLYPPAPLLVPRETKNDTILHGYKINQKTVVYINAWAIGRDPEAWESPEEFWPERFMSQDIDYKGNDFEFIPFGAGRRICPGMSMGVVTIELLLANLVFLFDWGLPSGMKKEDIDFDVLPGITMHKKNDLFLIPHACVLVKRL